MKKMFLLATAVLLGIATAMAVPAKRGVKKTLTLKDGTRVEGTLTGDEHVNFYRTADNRAIQMIDGQFQYVDIDSLHALHTTRMNACNRVRAQKAPSKTKYTGQRRGLVILVEFTDVKFTYSQETLNDFFNKVGFSECGMTGSVHDYFLEQSYGQFDLEFDVVGPVTASHNAYYYSTDNTRVPALVKEICRKVDADVDFSTYDWDSNGMVDQVYVLYAGYGAAQGATGTIWPHEWQVSVTGSAYTTGEGVKVDTYGTSCELRGNGVVNTGLLDGVGTPCHEFSHCLGLPDFYDTRENGTNFGMNSWDLMDYGCYNGVGNGLSPSGYTAYERWVSGWLEPTELNSSQQVTNMPAIQDEPVAYIIYNEKNNKEYYMLENYQLKGFDAAGYGHGMLVIHVDYDVSAWTTNTVNNTSDHQRMTIIPADNALAANTRSLAGDPYPGTSGNTDLTDNSKPAATLYNANLSGEKLMNKPITEIDEVSGLITFNFMGGVVIEAPVALEATNINKEAGTFTANWQPIDGAQNYTVALTKTTLGDNPYDFFVFGENFEKFESEVAGSDDISGTLDEYTHAPGWTGENLFTSPYRLRVGKTSMAGHLLTPVYEQPENEAITVLLSPISTSFRKTGSLELRIIAVDMDGQYAAGTLSEIPTVGSEDEGLTYLMSMPGWQYGHFQLGIYPEGSGVYMNYLAALDGEYSWDDFDLAESVPATKGISANKVKRIELDINDFQWSGGSAPAPLASKPRRAQKIESTTYYTTEDTKYAFTGLENASYSYKVYATTAAGRSAWSDEITVDMSDAITTVKADQKVSNGKVYMLDGRLAGNTLRPGLYVRDGKKFMVK